MALAASLLENELKTCSSLLDIGCGSGLLAQAILNDPRRKYRGVDISRVAIEAARERFEWCSDRVQFECADALGVSRTGADLAVFLGLLDWLTAAESREFFLRRREERLLFSFTESTGFFSRVYSCYRSATDSDYRPRSLDEATVVGWLDLAGYRPVELFRSPLLGPACLVLAAKI